ncbi:MAG: DUF1365 domain-containing protein [Planctomycetaceae bacterium]
MESCLYSGRVRHRRFGPRPHEFSYKLFMPFIDLGELDGLMSCAPFCSTSFAAVWFRRKDFLGDPALSLDEAVRQLLEERCGLRPKGPIRLLTNLRYWGVSMNPVCFYFCYDETGVNVETLVAEVNNTPWGEKYCYVVQNPFSTDNASSKKVLHVSPFMGMDMKYVWKLTRPGQGLSIHIENHAIPGSDTTDSPAISSSSHSADHPDHVFVDATKSTESISGASSADHLDTDQKSAIFDATLTLNRVPWTRWNLARQMIRFPCMTATVTAGIYWQALRLWLKGVPFVPHPRVSLNPSSNGIV